MEAAAEARPFEVPLYNILSKYGRPLLLIILKPRRSSICFQRCTRSFNSWVTSFKELFASIIHRSTSSIDRL